MENEKEEKMEITTEWLQKEEANSEDIFWFKNQKETDGLKIVKKLIDEKQLNWANWLIVRIMSPAQCMSYAIFAAEQVYYIYEKNYPGLFSLAQKGITIAKKCFDNPNKENIEAADKMERKINNTIFSINPPAPVAYAVTLIAEVINTANVPTVAAYAADNASVAYAEKNSIYHQMVDYLTMKLKIINYGISLLQKGA